MHLLTYQGRLELHQTYKVRLGRLDPNLQSPDHEALMVLAFLGQLDHEASQVPLAPRFLEGRLDPKDLLLPYQDQQGRLDPHRL